MNRILAASEEIARRFVRTIAPTSIFRIVANSVDTAYGAAEMGIGPYLKFRSLFPESCPDPRSQSGLVRAFHFSSLRHPVLARPWTTDMFGIQNVCIRKSYAAKLPRGDVRLIIDAGANIGDTTVWYLSTFPNAIVYAVEPNPENFDLLVKNCEPYGTRARPIKAALWNKHCRLTLDDSPRNDAFVVTEDPCGPCDAISPSDILRDSGQRNIDVLKCDIEGSEALLFAENYEWLNTTQYICIEIHNADCMRAVMSAVRGCGFTAQPTKFRELHIFCK